MKCLYFVEVFFHEQNIIQNKVQVEGYEEKDRWIKYVTDTY